MIDKTNIEYINFLTSTSRGNIKSAFIVLINSINSFNFEKTQIAKKQQKYYIL